MLNNILRLCTGWLDGRKVMGHRMTGWRTPAIKARHWQTAWSYMCERYRAAAFQLVRSNNAAGNCTRPHTPALQALDCGSPWNQQGEFTSDMGHGYLSPIIRGDSRTPKQLWDANGFQD